MSILYTIFLLLLLLVVVLLYVRGLDYMDSNHKDYTGYDLFDEENNSLNE